MRKFLRRCLYSFCFIIGLLSLMLCFLFYTNTGLNWSLFIAKKIIGTELIYSGISGKLADNILINHLSYHATNFTFEIDHAQLKFNPWELLLRRLNIQSLFVAKIEVHQNLIAENDNKKFAIPMLPVTIEIDQAQVSKFKYSNNRQLSIAIKNIWLTSTLENLSDKTNLITQMYWNSSQLKYQKQLVLINRGEFFFKGTPAAYNGTLVSNIYYNKLPKIKQQFEFYGSLQNITLQRIQLQTTAGTINGHAMFGWEPRLQWQLNLHSTGINAKHFNIPVTAHLAFNLITQAEKTSKGFVGYFRLKQFNGEIENKPFHSIIDVDFFQNGFNTHNSQIHFGNSNITLNGGLNSRWNLNWSINIKNFNDFFNIGTGSLISHGQIMGATTAPDIKAIIDGHNINIYDLKIAQFATVLNLNQLMSSNSTVKIIDLSWKNLYLHKLDVDLLGTIKNNNIKIYLENEYLSLATLLQGGWQQQQWQGKITQLIIKNSETWTMPAVTTLLIGKNSQQLNNLCLHNNIQTVCGSILHNENQTHLFGKLANLNLQSLFDFFDSNLFKNLQTNSTVNGNFNFQKNKSTTGQLNLNISPGSISIKTAAATQLLKFQKSSIIGKIANNQLTLAAGFNFANAQTIKANILINPLNEGLQQQKILGSIKLNYNDFLLLKTLYPEIQQVNGTLNGTLNISGYLLNPTFSGKINLSRGILVIPSIGITVKNITMVATGDNSGKIDLIGQASSGLGILHLQGNAALLSAGLPLKIKLTGKQILVLNTPSYKVYVSPNLTIQKNADIFLINGNLEIPTATISPTNFSESSESLSSDVQFISKKKKTIDYIYSGTVHVMLGKNVDVSIKGLSGQLTGAMQINLNSATTTTADGILSVTNGQYSGYGQTLALQTGKIIYTGGPIDNPGIELIGSKTIITTATSSTPVNSNNNILAQNFSLPTSYSQGKPVKVGIHITGTLQDYSANLFSDPAMYSQSDILSLLLTGQTADNLSGNNAQLLLKAASALNLGGSTVGNVTQQLQQFFGLDELGIDSQNYILNGNPTQTTALTLGKRLTPRLSISYSIGLLNPINIFLANYRLTNNWNLQANASVADTGADIFYNIER